jgi:hypothetical protein
MVLAGGGAGDAGDAGGDGGADAGQTPALGPALAGLSPATGARATAVTLQLSGAGFATSAVVLFDEQPVPTTRQSDQRLTAAVPATLTSDAGFHSVVVAGGGGGPRSGVAYYAVATPPGWPEVVDFNPDSGVAGDKIRVVGFNLSAQALQVTDAAGRRAMSGRIGTVAGTNTLLETAEFTVPDGWQSGPMLVGNAAGSFRGKVFTVGKNLALLPGTKLTASSEYGGAWTIPLGADNDIFTSWFTAEGDCVSKGAPTCKTAPWFQITFPSPQTVGRLALRGNRAYTTGYDFLRARFEVLGPGDVVLWSAVHTLLEPDRDLDVVLPMAISGAIGVRFRSEGDESEDPGFGEFAVFGP